MPASPRDHRGDFVGDPLRGRCLLPWVFVHVVLRWRRLTSRRMPRTTIATAGMPLLIHKGSIMVTGAAAAAVGSRWAGVASGRSSSQARRTEQPSSRRSKGSRVGSPRRTACAATGCPGRAIAASTARHQWRQCRLVTRDGQRSLSASIFSTSIRRGSPSGKAAAQLARAALATSCAFALSASFTFVGFCSRSPLMGNTSTGNLTRSGNFSMKRQHPSR
jgi:hypothetical protein